MQVIKFQSNQTFQGLNYGRNFPDIIKQTIETSNAFRKFGKKYNAEIDYVQIKSPANKSHPAFVISNIVPKGIQKLIDKVKGVNSKKQFMYLTTHGQNEQDLYNKYTTVSDNYIIKSYQRTFSQKK